jgi:hypothetical protein
VEGHGEKLIRVSPPILRSISLHILASSWLEAFNVAVHNVTRGDLHGRPLELIDQPFHGASVFTDRARLREFAKLLLELSSREQIVIMLEQESLEILEGGGLVGISLDLHFCFPNAERLITKPRGCPNGLFVSRDVRSQLKVSLNTTNESCNILSPT